MTPSRKPYSAGGSPAFGANPWQQAHWDWRAAGNFICGGAGAGLLVFTIVSGIGGWLAIVLLLAGLGLVGLGLLCVWLEIGRPLRALNVFFNPRTSWMTREAIVSLPLFALGLAVVLGVQAAAPVAALTALAFVYCQARIVQGGKGIPAWREPLTVPLLVVSGLAEGGGLFIMAAGWWVAIAPPVAVLFAALVVTRWLLWRAWRARLSTSASPRALAVLDRAGTHMRWLGSALPLALVVLMALAPAGIASALLATLAGATAAFNGAAFKFVLITRAAFNQGFTLTHLPVRGVPR